MTLNILWGLRLQTKDKFYSRNNLEKFESSKEEEKMRMCVSENSNIFSNLSYMKI